MLSTSPELIKSFETIPPIGNSDHNGMLSTISMHTHPAAPKVPRKIWRYNFADFERANEILSQVDATSVIEMVMLEHPGQTGKHCFWRRAYPLVHCPREGTYHCCPDLSFNLYKKRDMHLEIQDIFPEIQMCPQQSDIPPPKL